jgi:putative endonuclease
MKTYYVYIILTNKSNKIFYVAFTDDIQRRINEHKNKVFVGFTKKYNVDKLVYFEKHLTIEEAQLREERIKRWRREWKKELIEKTNPRWEDLSNNFEKILTSEEKIDLLFGSKLE